MTRDMQFLLQFLMAVSYTHLNEEMEYKIVGSTEADSLKGKISNESPVGDVYKRQGVSACQIRMLDTHAFVPTSRKVFSR